MEKEKRKKYAIIAIIILVIILLIFLVSRLFDKSMPGDKGNEFTPPEFTPPSAQVDKNDIPDPVESNTEFDVINLARNFVERFGSWSTDNQGHNLEELLVLSSAKMEKYLLSIPIDNTIEEYTGITTKSLSTKILSLTEEDALINVVTQRVETQDDLSQEIYYQDIEIGLIKSGNKWLVSSAYWQ